MNSKQMNESNTEMKSVLISVSDKRNIVPLAKFLIGKGYQIISTGGTFQRLKTLGDQVIEVNKVTDFPEILEGRVKTLHPKIFGSILAKNTELHDETRKRYKIPKIEAVVVNLYPFEKVLHEELAKPSEPDTDRIIENIDIGGHTLIRASVKNYENVRTLIDPDDYNWVMSKWDNFDIVSQQKLVIKAMQHVTEYDQRITEYLSSNKVMSQTLVHQLDFKYGLNPDQKPAGLYFPTISSNSIESTNFPMQVLNGKPGYINTLDALLGWQLVKEVDSSLYLPAAASYKHNSPAGAAYAVPLTKNDCEAYLVKPEEVQDPVCQAFIRARNGDPLSSFGDFIAISRKVDIAVAKLIKREISDGIIAPEYTPEAIEILKKKKNGNFVILQMDKDYNPPEIVEYRTEYGITLGQKRKNFVIDENFLQPVSEPQNSMKKQLETDTRAIQDLILANIVLKYTQSNSICLCRRSSDWSGCWSAKQS